MNVYDPESAEGMYAAGRIAALALDEVEKFLSVNPYCTTLEIDKLCDSFITKHGGIPECVGYKSHASPVPYMHATCISVNDVACHGVPSDYRLHDGDILNVDLVVRFPGANGWLGDTSRSFGIGNITPENAKLLEVAKNCMYAGMKVLRNGIEFKTIGAAVEAYCKTQKINGKQFRIIPDFCGHGISKHMHEPPLIEHVRNHCAYAIKPYQYFTIEPIITLGDNVKTYTDNDLWTVKTRDRANTAQFEHTMGLGQNGKLMIFTTRDREHEAQILQEISELKMN